MKARVSGAAFAASDSAVAVTVSVPRGLESSPQVIVVGRRASAARSASRRARARCSRARRPPSRRRGSPTRARGPRRCGCGRSSAPPAPSASSGSQAVSVTVTAIGAVARPGGAAVATRRARRPRRRATTSRPRRRAAPASSRPAAASARGRLGRQARARADGQAAPAPAAGRRKNQSVTREHQRPDQDLAEHRRVVVAEEAASTVPERASRPAARRVRSQTGCCRWFQIPASCRLRSTVAAKPGGDEDDEDPGPAEEPPQVEPHAAASRCRSRAAPRPAMPSSAPSGAAGPGLCWKSASRKNTDSRPSRATAKKLMPISAQAGPRAPASAASMSCSIVALIEREALRIQKTIEISTTTATAPTIGLEELLRPLRELRADADARAAPTNSDSATASSTPDPDRRQPVARGRCGRDSRR